MIVKFPKEKSPIRARYKSTRFSSCFGDLCDELVVLDFCELSLTMHMRARARNTLLNCCAAYGCWNGGYKIWQDNVTLVDCLSYHNEVSNVELDWDGDPGTTTLRNCHFVGSLEFNVWVENSNDHLHMYNCILACGDNIGLRARATSTQASLQELAGT